MFLLKFLSEEIEEKVKLLNVCLYFSKGENILGVLKYLAKSDILSKSYEYRHGNVVFFDILGLFVLAYPARVGAILNYVITALAVLYLGKKTFQPRKRGKSRSIDNFLTKWSDYFPYF